jgi:hypothetical protein
MDWFLWVQPKYKTGSLSPRKRSTEWEGEKKPGVFPARFCATRLRERFPVVKLALPHSPKTAAPSHFTQPFLTLFHAFSVLLLETFSLFFC